MNGRKGDDVLFNDDGAVLGHVHITDGGTVVFTDLHGHAIGAATPDGRGHYTTEITRHFHGRQPRFVPLGDGNRGWFMVHDLKDLPPDRSKVLHRFNDAWTIRHIAHDHDLVREGITMRTCVQPLAFARRTLKVARDQNARVLSLRDEHNQPHLTFAMYTNNGRMAHHTGVDQNTKPTQQQLARLAEFSRHAIRQAP